MQDLKQQLDFILELDRFKAVYRKVMVKSDKNRPETVPSIAGILP